MGQQLPATATIGATEASLPIDCDAAGSSAVSVLAAARQFHREGRDEEAVDLLAQRFESRVVEDETGGADAAGTYQAMLAMGCWLCNSLATEHLLARRVARAFGYTRTCEQWLDMRGIPQADDADAEMWLRLSFDRALNAAELAKASDDLPQSLEMLRKCERLQASMHVPPRDPEVVHICLAEVLLQRARHAEAASAAARAVELLQPQLVAGDERKAFALLFALSLQQSALDAAGQIPCALRCLAAAEAAWAYSIPEDGGQDPPGGAEAARKLLARMRQVHRVMTLRMHGMRAQSASASGSTPPVAVASAPPAALDMPPTGVSSATPARCRHARAVNARLARARRVTLP